MVIADPETKSIITHIVGGGIGGGPSIIWAKDGSGIVDDLGGGEYGVRLIEDGSFKPFFPDVYNPRGEYGPGGAGLRLCNAGENCPGGDDGRVLLQRLDGTSTVVYEPTGEDRVIGASFGSSVDEYLLQLVTDKGRQIAIDRVVGDQVEHVRELDRPTEWNYFGLDRLPADDSMLVFFVDLGNDHFGTAITGFDQGALTYHEADFAGYLTSRVTDAGDGSYLNTGYETVGPGSLSPYPMQSIEDLIAAEKKLNPGRVVVAQASHDAVESDSATEEYTVTVDRDVSPEVYLDCYGPENVTVRFGTYSVVSPCLGGGTFIGTLNEMGAGDEATITATHDTTWRVVMYTMEQSPGDTPPPVAEPAQP